jgi:hypothetical protein
MKPIKKAIEEPPPNVEKIMFHTKALAKVPASPPSSSYCNSLPTFEGVEEAALSPKPTLGDNLHPSTLPPATSVLLEMSMRKSKVPEVP